MLLVVIRRRCGLAPDFGIIGALLVFLLFFFFFNDTATTEIYTLSLHDALPICLAFDVVGDWVSIMTHEMSNLKRLIREILHCKGVLYKCIIIILYFVIETRNFRSGKC